MHKCTHHNFFVLLKFCKSLFMLTFLGFFWNDTNILVNSENQLPQIYYLDYVLIFKREYPISKSDEHYSTLSALVVSWSTRLLSKLRDPCSIPGRNPIQGLKIILNEWETTVLSLHSHQYNC